MATQLDRCNLVKAALLTVAVAALSAGPAAGQASLRQARGKPNIIICLTDDQGWGDVGYNGHPHLKTPNLDQMSTQGIRFDNFYAQPVCSPARASLMTGRHPNRMGTFLYNYSIRPEEHTIAEALKGAGYATGMFGKWHLGPVQAGSPTNPGAKGFDHWIAHDNFFENDPEFCVDGSAPRKFTGESSAVTVDLALKFIQKQHAAGKPFFAYVCFGSPHVPHKAASEFKKLYVDRSDKEQNYLGEISGIDAAMGTLRESLRKLSVADNTLLWFISDNGAAKQGSTGGLSGKKGSVKEGGVRVPALLEWPAGIKKPFTTTVTASTCDLYPTILDLLGIQRPDDRPLDGVSLVPLMEGKMETRPAPLAFWVFDLKNGKEPWIDPAKQKGNWRTFKNWKYPNPRTGGFGGSAAIIVGRYKYHSNGQLYDLQADRKEAQNLATRQADVAQRMKKQLEEWQTSVEKSLSGADYK